MKKVKVIITVLLIVFCSLNGKSQVTPDSLKGYYIGQYYFKYDSDPNWTISTDTVFVTNIDISNCTISHYGSEIFASPIGFETHYSFCYGNTPNIPNYPNIFIRFYSEDSIWMNLENVSMPPPDIGEFSKIFKGKKAGVLTSINDTPVVLSFNLYPNPANDKLYLSFKYLDDNSLVSIYNLKGQLVYSKSINQTDKSLEIDIKGIPKGLYLLHLSSKNSFYSSKFLNQ